jgi:5-methylcytosine-specific restriction enzyme subunit McrC
MQHYYDSDKLHSTNLYQIFTYVKNKDSGFGEQPHTVSGMLLYAATDDDIQPNACYHICGNKISVRTLDLNCEFDIIKKQLDAIIEEHFGVFGESTKGY